MELITKNYEDFVKLADVKFWKAKKSVEQVMRNSGFVVEVPIAQNSGNTREFSEIDLQEYAMGKSESDQSSRAKAQQGYSKTMTNYRVSADIGISYEMRTQGKYVDIINKLTNLGKLAPNRLDLDLSHRITFAGSTSYTNMDGKSIDISVGDGKALAATDHTLKGSDTTFRNILANNPKLSKGSLQSMRRLIVNETYNHLGEKMTMDFDILFTTDEPSQVDAAQELLSSKADVESSNSGVKNVMRGKFKHVVLPRLATDAQGAPDSDKDYYWGIISSEHSTFYLGVWEEPHMKRPSSLNAAEEFSTDDWNFGVRAGWGICIPSAAWIKMSKGDASA